MARLQDIFRKLNKSRKEVDKLKFASEQDENYFKKTTTSTSSPFLDLVTNGGYTQGGYNILIAEGGTGKSSVALLAIKEEFESTGRVGVYYDGEGTMDESYMARMGVTKDMIIYIKDRNLEEMLDTVEAFSTANEVGIIILDSVPIFVSSVVEAKSASENNMAVEARKWTARMPIIEGNCSRRNITIIGLTSYKMDPGAMGDPRQLTRGRWQYTMANLIMDMTKKKIIKNSEGKEVGHELEIRVKKSKIVSYDPFEVHKVNFYYDGGFNKYDEYVSIFIAKDIIRQAGAWFYLPDKNAEEVKINGKNAVISYIKENEENFNYLMTLLDE